MATGLLKLLNSFKIASNTLEPSKIAYNMMKSQYKHIECDYSCMATNVSQICALCSGPKSS